MCLVALDILHALHSSAGSGSAGLSRADPSHSTTVRAQRGASTALFHLHALCMICRIYLNQMLDELLPLLHRLLSYLEFTLTAGLLRNDAAASGARQ